VCYLRVYDITSTPEFYTLSYTWGTELADYFVQVNDERKPVTQSCFEALISLRQHKCLFVWIDQLCVDQENLAERSEQVVLMHQIYSRALAVYVWLGRFDETDHRQTSGRATSWRKRLKNVSTFSKGIP
jgi:hypothetical protein